MPKVYGESHVGHWLATKSVNQNAVNVAEAKYPKDIVVPFLCLTTVNTGPGGAQPLMHDFEYQEMYFAYLGGYCWVCKCWNRIATCPERFRTRAFES